MDTMPLTIAGTLERLVHKSGAKNRGNSAAKCGGKGAGVRCTSMHSV